MCISITLASTDKPMFFGHTKGVTPNQMSRVEGIKNGVQYLQMSTWRASHPYGGNTESVGPDCNLTPGHGGWPIRVRGVEGMVAVLVVHGLGPKLNVDGSVARTEVGTENWSSSVETASLDHELILNALDIVINEK